MEHFYYLVSCVDCRSLPSYLLKEQVSLIMDFFALDLSCIGKLEHANYFPYSVFIHKGILVENMLSIEANWTFSLKC